MADNSRSPSVEGTGSRSGSRFRTRRHRGGRRRGNASSSGLPGYDEFDDVIRARAATEGEEDSAPPKQPKNKYGGTGLPGVDDFDEVIRARMIAEGEEDSAPPKPIPRPYGGSGLPGIDDFDAVIAERARREDGGDGGRGGVPAIPPNDPRLRTGEWALVGNKGAGLPGYDEFDDVINERMEREGANDAIIKLMLELNLDVVVEIKAKIHGDLTISLLR